MSKMGLPHIFTNIKNMDYNNTSLYACCGHCLSDKTSKLDYNNIICHNCDFKGTYKDFQILTISERNKKLLFVNRINKIHKIKNKYQNG